MEDPQDRKLHELQQRWTQLGETLSRLREDHLCETRTEEKQRLDHRIARLEDERATVERGLDRLEADPVEPRVGGRRAFKARLGDRANPGLLPDAERLARVQPDHNPYVRVGALPADSPVFFGRRRELSEVLGILRRPGNPGCVSLLGERRIGKSSLLSQVHQALAAEQGLVAVHANAQDWGRFDPPAFFRDLHQAIRRVLPDAPQRTVANYADFRNFVADHAARWRFVLIVDEFDDMAANPALDDRFFTNLRALGDDADYAFGFLLASRQPLERLCQQGDIGSSAFWNIFGMPYVLGLLESREAEDLARKPFRQSLGKPLRDLKKVWHWCGHHPAMLQMVMWSLWQAREGGYPLPAADLRDGLGPYYHDLWRRRSQDEWKLLLALVENHEVRDSRTLRELERRGLVRDGRLFSGLFAESIPHWLPDGTTPAEAFATLNEGAEKAGKFFDRMAKAATSLGKLRKAFYDPDEETGEGGS